MFRSIIDNDITASSLYNSSSGLYLSNKDRLEKITYSKENAAARTRVDRNVSYIFDEGGRDVVGTKLNRSFSISKTDREALCINR